MGKWLKQNSAFNNTKTQAFLAGCMPMEAGFPFVTNIGVCGGGHLTPFTDAMLPMPSDTAR